MEHLVIMVVFLSVSSGSRCSNIYFLSLHKISYLRIEYLLSNVIIGPGIGSGGNP